MKLFSKLLNRRQSAASRRRRQGLRLRGESLETRRLMTTAHGDFNGDGVDDLAYGVPFEDLGAIVDAGAVNVIYGTNSWSGLSSAGNQLWHQNSPGILDVAEANDHFGSALASGDFDNDGYDDLAIGVPGESIGAATAAGAVQVLYGSPTGLTATGDQLWNQNSPGILDVAETYDAFGQKLAVGDFNNDGRDDLAVGVLGEDVGVVNCGAVNVIYGRSPVSGLTSAGNQFWHQNSPGIEGVPEIGDAFGASLATGDFNGDGRDDLAIGVPHEDVGAINDAGAVNVIYGRYAYSGLGASGDQLWHQNTAGILDVAEPYDLFGYSLATGDFNNDGRDDLAVGAWCEDVLGINDAGAVNVIYGRSAISGLTSAGDQFWHQNVFGIEGVAEDGDAFGYSLTTGDFNGDGRDDLAIGVSREDIGGVVNAGATNVIYGRHAWNGLTRAGDQVWHQNTPGINDSAEFYDNFGAAMTAGDFNGDGRADLAIHVPLESVGATPNVSAVEVIYGRYATSGLSSIGDQLWHQNSPGILGVGESSDGYSPIVY